MNYETFFSELEMFGIKLGLEQTRELFSCIGNPDKTLRFIHIAGTNGKGSVGAMLASALTVAGFKVGFYTSPHLLSVRERFRIDGKAISEEELEELIEKIKPAIKEMKKRGSSPTYFEVTTALAAAYFATHEVRFVIWETGLGGRFDATNIVTPEISIITTVGMDHTAHLGSTLAEIAEEKAGIIKKGIPVFCGMMPQDAEKVIRKKAEEMNSEVYFNVGQGLCSAQFSTTSLIKKDKQDACPTFQDHANKNDKQDACPTFKHQNQALAKNVLQYLSQQFSFSFNKAAEGISKVKWPGRFQILDNGSVIDGAHNPQATEALIASLQSKFPDEKFTILFASFADKDVENSLKLLATVAEEFIFAEVETTRKTCHPDKLEKIIRKFTDIPVRKVADSNSGLKLPRQARLLVTGSLYLVGEVLKESIPGSEILDVYYGST